MTEGKIIVLLGAPGAGKGTQAELLAAEHGMIHVSTGDILREEVRRESSLGRKVKTIMDAGELVPDELVAEIVGRKLDSADGKDFILDGFPRNLFQAEYLESVLKDRQVRAVNIRVDEDELVRRLSGRRYCRECGKIYNVYFSPPKEKGSCDACGSPLTQRPDDREEVISERIRVYREQTEPVIEFYSTRGLYSVVDGSRSVEEVAEEVSVVLEDF